MFHIEGSKIPNHNKILSASTSQLAWHFHNVNVHHACTTKKMCFFQIVSGPQYATGSTLPKDGNVEERELTDL